MQIYPPRNTNSTLLAADHGEEPISALGSAISRINGLAERARRLGATADRVFGERASPQSPSPVVAPPAPGAIGEMHGALDDLERALCWAEQLTELA